MAQRSSPARGLAFAAVLALTFTAQAGPAGNRADAEPSLNDRLAEQDVRVHDPAILRVGDTYHLFSTGHLGERTGIIPWRVSKNLVDWAFVGPVFRDLPDWAPRTIEGARGLWAPDIVQANGEYRLYYAVSTFGKNRSAIGLAVTRSLDPASPDFGWEDRGPVLQSFSGDDFNAIDPNIFIDRDGRHWMSFGSFWGGIKLVELDPATGKRKAEDGPIHSIASRPGGEHAIEAPFLIARGGSYYLFVSFDFCCRGVNSTYHTVVGRADNVLGPYVDRDGKLLLDGGGTVVLHTDQDPGRRWIGPGHSAILRDNGQDYIVYHAYDATRQGAPALRIQPLEWTEDGWPVAR